MADDIAGRATLTDESRSSVEGGLDGPYDNNRMGRIRSESRDCHRRRHIGLTGCTRDLVFSSEAGKALTKSTQSLMRARYRSIAVVVLAQCGMAAPEMFPLCDSHLVPVSACGVVVSTIACIRVSGREMHTLLRTSIGLFHPTAPILGRKRKDRSGRSHT